MVRMQVTKEHSPTRCEICHQSDLYDSINNTCYRCKNIPLEKNIAHTTSYQNNHISALVGFINGLLAGSLFSQITNHAELIMYFNYQQEKFLIPNWKYCVCEALIIPLGLLFSLVLLNNQLHIYNTILHRFLVYLAIPISLFVIDIISIRWFSLLALFITPIIIAIVEVIYLWLITKKWHWFLAIMTIMSVILTPFITYQLAKWGGSIHTIPLYCAFLTSIYLSWLNQSQKEKVVAKRV